MDVDQITRSYAIAALWSSVGDNGSPLDDQHDIDDIDPATYAAMRADVVAFLEANADDVAQLAYPGRRGAEWATEDLLGHDLWLTRNHHGAGFWDRGLGELGDRLTAAAHAMGEVNLWVAEPDDDAPTGKVFQD